MADDYVDPLAGNTVFQNTAGPERLTPAPAAPDASGYVDPLGASRSLETDPDANKLDIELPWWKRSWRAISRAATGEGSMEFPTLPEMTEWKLPLGADLRMGAQYHLAGEDPKALADTVKKALPDATIDMDSFGNPTVTWQGKTAYLNKPGMSAADVMAGLGAGASALGAGGLVAAIPKLAGTGLVNTAIRSVVSGLAQGGADVGQQLTAGVVGSDQGVDFKRAAEAAIGGAAAEPVVAAAGTGLRPLGTLAGVGRRALVDVTGQGGSRIGNQWLTTGARALADDAPLAGNMLNRTGQLFLENAGLNLANLPPDLTVGAVRTLMDRVPAGAITRAVADTREARDLARNLVGAARFEIPTTAGQAAGNRAMIGREDWLAHSEDPGRAITPATVMQGFREGQREAIEGTAARLVPGNAASRTPVPESDIGLNIARQGQARLNQMRADEQTAWDRAGASTGAGVRADVATNPHRVLYFDENGSHQIIDQLREAANRTSMDPARAELQRVASMLSATRGGGTPGAALANEITARRPAGTGRWDAAVFNQGDFQETRKYLTTALADAGNDAPKRRALREMINALDTGADAAVAGGQVAGNPALLGEMRNAIAVSRERFRAYAPHDDAARGFMEKITTPNVSGQEIVDHLYGGRTGTTQVLDHLDTVFPAGSPMHESLRQGAVQRMLGGVKETPTDLTAAALASRMSKRIAEATNTTGNGWEVTSRLLSADEIAQLRDFRTTLDTIAASGTRNTSGTAYALGDAFRHFASGKSQLFSRWLGDQMKATGEARRAVDQAIPSRGFRPTDMAPGTFRSTVAPAAGGVAGRERVVLPAAAAAAMRARGLLYGP